MITIVNLMIASIAPPHPTSASLRPPSPARGEGESVAYQLCAPLSPRGRGAGGEGARCQPKTLSADRTLKRQFPNRLHELRRQVQIPRRPPLALDIGPDARHLLGREPARGRHLTGMHPAIESQKTKIHLAIGRGEIEFVLA